MMKRFTILLLAAILLLLAACTADSYTPPPAQTQKPDKDHKSNYNSSVPISDTWEGEACRSLVLSIYMLRDEEDFISHVEICGGEMLLGVIAFGRSLPCQTVNGERVFTLTPDLTEATALNDGTFFCAQLYFKGNAVPSIRVQRVFNTHTHAQYGDPYANREPERLLTTREIQALKILPEIDALPQALHFAGEVRYFPETGVYKAHYIENRWITATPSDGKFEKHMQYEMEHGYCLDIECYPYKNTKYYIIEGWPTGPDVSEEEHTFSIKWEKDGYVYDLCLIRAVTSHDQAKQVVHGIKY